VRFASDEERGGGEELSPGGDCQVVLRAIREPWMWAGVAMMASAFFALLGALSMYNVSFVVPVTALSYVAGVWRSGVLGAVTARRWIGVALVTIG